MGEDFLSWADEYFSDDERRNERLKKRDVYDNFVEYAPDQRKFTSQSVFKKKIRAYCQWKEYLFNPNKYDPTTGLCMFFDKDGRPDDSDKSGGVEFIMIGDKEKWRDSNRIPESIDDRPSDIPF